MERNSSVAPKRFCVFCGSSAGTKPVYRDHAREMGTEIAQRGMGLVYGGGNTV